MTLIKAPRLEQKHLLVLKNLIRLDFARAVRKALYENQNAQPASVTLKILKFADAMTDCEQPLLVALSMMEIYSSEAISIPLDDRRVSFFEHLLSIEIGENDFPGVGKEDLDRILDPLRVVQVELRSIFADADYLDPSEIKRQNPRSGRPGPAGALN